MKWYLAILALVGLSIPLVRSLRSPWTVPNLNTTPPMDPPADPASVPMWVGSADTPTPTPDAQSTFGAGVAVLANFGASLVQTAKGVWTPPAKAAPYLADINAATDKYGLPPNLLARQVQKESSFNPNAVSSAGALGLAQFLPSTAADFGIDPLNPTQAIDAMGQYMSQLYSKFGSWTLALAAYNWGQGNLAKKGLAAAPAETQSYYKTILADIGMPVITS